LLSERSNHITEAPTSNNTSESREGPQGRNPVHYEEEWVSLIAAESATLISDLLQYPVSDDEAPQPGFPEPPGSSVYDSDTGEAPDSVTGPDQNPGTPSNYPILPDPATLSSTVALKEILESFPLPPSRDSTGGERIFPNVHPTSLSLIPTISAQANISTLDRNEATDCTSSSRLTESLLGDIFSAEEQSSTGLRDAIIETYHNADPSLCGISELRNTPASSPDISTPSYINSPVVVEPHRISRQFHLPISQPLRSPPEPENCLPSQTRRSQYSVFPRLVSPESGHDYELRPPRRVNSQYIGHRKRRRTSRFNRQTPTPLRISVRASTVSIASKPLPPLPPVSKPKKDLKFAVEKVKLLLRQTRNFSLSPFVLKN
jgi:hypothetical protein